MAGRAGGGGRGSAAPSASRNAPMICRVRLTSRVRQHAGNRSRKRASIGAIMSAMGIEAWSPRELEDLDVACTGCGAYATDRAFGPRDWLESPDKMRADEIDARIDKARGLSLPESEPDVDDDLLDEDTANAEVPWLADGGRVNPSTDAIGCPACDGDLGLTWQDLARGHACLSAKDINWLHGYITMKESIVCALRHAGVGYRGDMGTFINAYTPAARAGGVTVSAQALPLFIPSKRFNNLVDKSLLGPEALLEKLGSEASCYVGDDMLPFPGEYNGPALVIEDELGHGLAEIAKALRERGSTPLRGIGTLRIVSYTWDGEHGRLVYLDFAPRIRDELADRFR
jgi:hypothetical protein